MQIINEAVQIWVAYFSEISNNIKEVNEEIQALESKEPNGVVYLAIRNHQWFNIVRLSV